MLSSFRQIIIPDVCLLLARSTSLPRKSATSGLVPTDPPTLKFVSRLTARQPNVRSGGLCISKPHFVRQDLHKKTSRSLIIRPHPDPLLKGEGRGGIIKEREVIDIRLSLAYGFPACRQVHSIRTRLGLRLVGGLCISIPHKFGKICIKKGPPAVPSFILRRLALLSSQVDSAIRHRLLYLTV